MQKIPLSGQAFCRILLCILLSISAFTASAETENLAENDAFTIGKVTSNALKQHKRLKPMADLLAAQLSLAEGETLFTKTIFDMQEKMRAGEVDLFTGSAYEAAILTHSGVGETLALKAKEGSKEYKSIIVVGKDSGIDSIKQLQGKVIAFEDESSTSAFRVPLIELQQAGLRLAENRQRPNKKGLLHYRFSGSEQNSAALLYRGVVDAIALSDVDWMKNENVPDFQKQSFKIIYQSQSIPRALEVVRNSLPDETKEKLKNILMGMESNETTAETMRSYHKTTGFSPVSESTSAYLEELGDYFSN